MNRMIENDARMRKLGLPALAQIIRASSNIQQETKNHDNNDDPDFDCTLEDEDDGDHSMDTGNLGSKKTKNTTNVHSVTQNATGGNRVVAQMLPGRVTRSKKVLGPEVHAAHTDTQPEISIQASSVVNPTDTQPEIPIQASSVINTSDTHPQIPIEASNLATSEDMATIPNLDEHTYNASNLHEVVETANDTNANENSEGNSEDAEAYEEERISGPTVGIGLDRMARSKRGKLPVVIEPGKIRPNSVKIAAKFTTECNIAVRNHVPIFPHWKDYKKQPGLIRFYKAKIASKFDMDTTAGPMKKACVAMMKIAVQQQRHKLKKKYFNPYPLHLVSKTSPVQSMNDAQWLKLVDHWKNESKMLISEKNKENRSKVQFHQTTGSRRYDMHIVQLENKYKDAPPNGLDLFKECHYSHKKQGFTPAVQTAIVEMESKLAEPDEKGCEPKPVNDVVSDVLVQKTRKDQFLRNVGIKIVPDVSNAPSQRELQAELALEKQAAADLRDLVNIQRQQLDDMVTKMQAAEEERASKDEEMRQK